MLHKLLLLFFVCLYCVDRNLLISTMNHQDKDELIAQQQEVILSLTRERNHFEQECRLLNLDLIKSRDAHNESATNAYSIDSVLDRERREAEETEQCVKSVLDILVKSRRESSPGLIRDGIDKATIKLISFINAEPASSDDFGGWS